jgi:UTP--glucose-1-phosphate uridylyltransferase
VLSVRKAVIPAAGFGTRFLPVTKSVPKEMLPIVDKPVIYHVVAAAVASGIDQIVLVTGSNKKALEDFFDTNFELEHTLEKTGKTKMLEELRAITSMAEIIYVRQHLPLGNGHAVLAARHVVGDEPFAVLWGDDIIVGDPPVPRQLLDVYERFDGPVIGVRPVPEADFGKYGMLGVEEIEAGVYRAHSVVEKPEPGKSPSNLAQIGGFILTPDIFDILAETREGTGGEIYLADALVKLMQVRPVYAYEFDGHRYDAGNKLDYLRANVEFALADPDLGDEFRRYLAGLELREPATG